MPSPPSWPSGGKPAGAAASRISGTGTRIPSQRPPGRRPASLNCPACRPRRPSNHRLWLAYAASCLLAWALWRAGGQRVRPGAGPVLAGGLPGHHHAVGAGFAGRGRLAADAPLVSAALLPFALGHLVGALSFGLAWLVGEYLLNSLLFGPCMPAPCCGGAAVARHRGRGGVCGDGDCLQRGAAGRAARRTATWRRPRPRRAGQGRAGGDQRQAEPAFPLQHPQFLDCLGPHGRGPGGAVALLRFASMLRYVLTRNAAMQRCQARAQGAAR